MGRRGPPPKPTKLKILAGNPGRRRLNESEPQPRAGIPRCPQWLDELARTCWKQIVPELESMGVLTQIDAQALAHYCDTWADWRRARDFLREHGQAYPLKNPDGSVRYLQPFPQVAIARNLLQVLTRYQQEFGMTPASRSRIHVTKEDKPETDFMGLILANSNRHKKKKTRAG